MIPTKIKLKRLLRIKNYYYFISRKQYNICKYINNTLVFSPSLHSVLFCKCKFLIHYEFCSCDNGILLKCVKTVVIRIIVIRIIKK